MASNEEKKRTLYGGSYDQELGDAYTQISERPSFSYDVDGDALYQQYKDRYTQNAKLAMKDTMGQATGLTGGYGSSYAQGVGQQRYDETMRGLTDMIPTLEQSAYQKYQNEGEALKDRYSMLNSMAATEQQTEQTRLQNEQANYSQLASLISSSGYQPTAEDLTRAGMNAEQANALRQMWMASNPGAAYMAGQLSADDYFKLTGQYPPDVAAAQAASSRGGGPTNVTAQRPDYTKKDKLAKVGGKDVYVNEYGEVRTDDNMTRGEIAREAQQAYKQGEMTYSEYKEIMASVR